MITYIIKQPYKIKRFNRVQTLFFSCIFFHNGVTVSYMIIVDSTESTQVHTCWLVLPTNVVYCYQFNIIIILLSYMHASKYVYLVHYINVYYYLHIYYSILLIDNIMPDWQHMTTVGMLVFPQAVLQTESHSEEVLSLSW